jgi:pimeloyl-ACP methyl ester carboxylesterase
MLCGLTALVVRADLPAESTKTLSFDARLTGYPYPFEVKTFEFESQNQPLEMAYMVLKGDSSNPWITLLHGKNFNGAYWEQTARWLQEQGYNVLIPDQIGFGKSSKPMDYQFSFATLAANTRQLMDELNIENSIIVGHSMGGMLASRFALLYPDVTQQLILVNPIGLENYLQYVQYQDIGFFFENEKKGSAEKIQAYQQKNYYDGVWNEQYEQLTVPLVGWVQGPDKEQMAWVSALTYDMIFTQPVVTEFQNLQVPTTLILGTRDRTGPGRGWMRDGVDFELGRYDLLGARMKEMIPEVKIYELDGLGHLPQIEDFARFETAFSAALQNSATSEK